MKYLQSGGYQDQPLMRLTLGLALLLLSGFWVTNLALYFAHMSLDPASVVAYYRGDEAEFRPARSFQSMLEVTHMHLPMFALVLLLLTHLLIFAPMRFATKVAFIVVAFGSALLSESAGWMTRFWHPGLAVLKVVAFALFQGSLAFLILGLGLYLASAEALRHRKRAERHREHASALKAPPGQEPRRP
ncbi:MAG TPA: hypothetical protein VEY91_02735 [Candidatus Limnocylindria bacterium]|nr:hypothetical protein [Candidatus Limnocylindria bacterium]